MSTTGRNCIIGLLGITVLLGPIAVLRDRDAPATTQVMHGLEPALLRIDPVTQACIQNKGRKANGEIGWRGSYGVSLEDFCDGVGAFARIERNRREHPERY